MVRTLDRKQREVLLLYFYGGLKLTEIAAKLRLPTSKVSARLCRACRELRRRFSAIRSGAGLGTNFILYFRELREGLPQSFRVSDTSVPD